MFSIQQMSPKLKRMARSLLIPPAPAHLQTNYKVTTPEIVNRIRYALRTEYFSRPIWGEVTVSPDEWLESDEGQKDLADHLSGRLDSFRSTVVPWLDAARPLRDAKILEIGCGTGSSAVALAEQGARVIGVDVDPDSLSVAQTRCVAYGLEVEFHVANATDVSDLFKDHSFDFIIFFASLEHMTHTERLLSMSSTWKMLPPGGHWCVVETPNRLWYFDSHTSRLPFFSWLPDDLAFAYSRFSPRKPFRESYRTINPDSLLSFLRHGRGVSFHEFELSMLPAAELRVVSYLAGFTRQRSRMHALDLLWRMTKEHRFSAFLENAAPDLHPGFCQPFLDIILKKI